MPWKNLLSTSFWCQHLLCKVYWKWIGLDAKNRASALLNRGHHAINRGHHAMTQEEAWTSYLRSIDDSLDFALRRSIDPSKRNQFVHSLLEKDASGLRILQRIIKHMKHAWRLRIFLCSSMHCNQRTLSMAPCPPSHHIEDAGTYAREKPIDRLTD